MPIMRDCGNAKINVTLHSEIGDVHQLAADVDYFFVRGASHVVTRESVKRQKSKVKSL